MRMLTCALMAGALLIPNTAEANPCPLPIIPVEPLKEHMLKEHGEVPHAMAWTGVSTFLVYVNPETKTWTIYEFDPTNKWACQRAAGVAWTDFDPPKPGTDS